MTKSRMVEPRETLLEDAYIVTYTEATTEDRVESSIRHAKA